MEINLMALFDIIGTVAFAVAGAMVGIQKKLDIFGILVFAMTTAVGGGIVRDVVISNTPPMVFRNEVYALSCVMSASIVMTVHHLFDKFNKAIQVCDAIGLGAFAVAGANMAVQFGYNNLLVVTFLSVVTAVGGGVIRDVFAQEIPSVFREEVYAVAALAGAVSFFYAHPYVEQDTAMYLCFSVTTGLRLLALKYHWNLPVV